MTLPALPGYLNRYVDGRTHSLDAVVVDRLYADMLDFIDRHRPCGTLTGDASEVAANGYMLTVGCSCGVVFMRWVTAWEAGCDLCSQKRGVGGCTLRTGDRG